MRLNLGRAALLHLIDLLQTRMHKLEVYYSISSTESLTPSPPPPEQAITQPAQSATPLWRKSISPLSMNIDPNECRVPAPPQQQQEEEEAEEEEEIQYRRHQGPAADVY